MENFSECIKKYRMDSGLTQEQLAKKLFVTKQAVSKWETGKGYPDAATLPVISNILGVSIDLLMGTEKSVKKKRSIKVIILSLISVIVVISIVTILYIFISYKAKNAQEVEEIETNINFEIPKYGEIVTFDFENWSQYGNSVSISIMSYIIFEENNDLIVFEEDIKNDETWINEVPVDLLVLIPQGIQSYLGTMDYFRIYNVSLDIYNELPANQDIYDYIFLIYQEDNQRLIIFEYSIEYQGGVYEE